MAPPSMCSGRWPSSLPPASAVRSPTGGPGSGDLISSGGGRLNHHLMSRIAHHAETFHVTMSDDHGIHGDHLEAAAFAWLAHRTLEGLPGNAPDVTGAKAPRVLGAIHPGNG